MRSRDFDWKTTTRNDWMAWPPPEWIRKIIGRTLDPDQCEVDFDYAYTLDPYGEDDLPEELQQVGREFYAYDPKREIALYFVDLPRATIEALSEKRKAADREGWRQIFELTKGGAPPTDDEW